MQPFLNAIWATCFYLPLAWGRMLRLYAHIAGVVRLASLSAQETRWAGLAAVGGALPGTLA